MPESPHRLSLATQTGLIQPAKQAGSPNHDRRPDRLAIDALIVHAISLPPGQYGGDYVRQFFCNQLDCSAHPYFEHLRSLRVSAHFFIARTGELTQFVPTHRRAWHAGVSCFRGRERVNDFSIGVELEGCDDDAFEPEQYAMLIRLSHCLIGHYPGIQPDNIVGHDTIAAGRKTDPGPFFDWPRFRSELGRR